MTPGNPNSKYWSAIIFVPKPKPALASLVINIADVISFGVLSNNASVIKLGITGKGCKEITKHPFTIG